MVEYIIQGGALGIAALMGYLTWKIFSVMITMYEKENGLNRAVLDKLSNVINENNQIMKMLFDKFN